MIIFAILFSFLLALFLYSGLVLKINEFTVLRKGEETSGKIGDPVILEALLAEQERSIVNMSPPLSQ